MKNLFVTATLLFVAVLVTVITGCEESSSDPGEVQAAGSQFANVEGVWQVNSGGYRWQMTVVQDRGELSGDLTDHIKQYPDMIMTGTVNGASVWMKGGNEVAGTGTIEGDTMTGTFNYLDGRPRTDIEWSATRDL